MRQTIEVKAEKKFTQKKDKPNYVTIRGREGTWVEKYTGEI